MKPEPARIDRRGFTLPEVMTAITVFAFVGAAITSVAIGTLNSVAYQGRMMDAQLDVTSAMALLQDDLRAAGYVPDNMNQAVFQQITAGSSSDSIQFVGDVNSDGISERITYAVDANHNLNRTQDNWNSTNLQWTAGTAQPVAANVTAFTLRFQLVNPCTGVISSQTAAQVLSPTCIVTCPTGSSPPCTGQCTSFTSITLSGTGTYKGQSVTRTLSSDVAERQQDVNPICS